MIPFASQPRPDEQVAAGLILNVSMGGVTRTLPVLPIGANRDFRKAFQTATDEVIGRVSDVETLADVVGQLGQAEDVMIDLLVRYDQSGALGGREYIEKHAAPSEIVETLRQVANAAFPFGVDLLKHVPTIRATLMQALMREVSPRSTRTTPQPTAGRRARSKAS